MLLSPPLLPTLSDWLCRPAPRIIYYLDVTAVSVFTLEYLLRWYASANRLMFPISLKNIIDILAIVPFYMSPLPPLCDGGLVVRTASCPCLQHMPVAMPIGRVATEH